MAWCLFAEVNSAELGGSKSWYLSVFRSQHPFEDVGSCTASPQESVHLPLTSGDLQIQAKTPYLNVRQVRTP